MSKPKQKKRKIKVWGIFRNRGNGSLNIDHHTGQLEIYELKCEANEGNYWEEDGIEMKVFPVEITYYV